MTGVGDDPLAAIGEVEETIRRLLDEQLRDAVDGDSTVAEALESWHGTAGSEPQTDAVRRAAARQANVLTNVVRYRVATGRSPPEPLRETPVTPFRGLDEPPAVEAALDDLDGRLRHHGAADVDLLGARYSEVLADEERRERGQFYTPAPVAELVVRWALADAGDGSRVLDPAAGTGTFPLAASDVLRERSPHAGPHSRVVAVDVDDVALHLASLRLSARTGGGPVDWFDRRRSSFFDLEPGEDVAPVDAVVGNPPFVRAGNLTPDRDHFREHLGAFGPDGEAPYVDGDRGLSRRCDASVYFVTHVTRFLRPGGRLGVVLPAKWLESDYGVGFRRFLDDQYRLHAVVGFGARAFDALVDTVLLLAERRGRGESGDDAPVRFVRLDGPMDVEGSLELLRTADSAGDGAQGRPTTGNGTTQTDSATVVTRAQRTVAEARQCSPYLRAPEALLSLLDHPALVPLDELAAVRRGVTTGANRFFLLDPADRERWGIDRRFLRPALRSMRGVEGRTLAADHVDRSILDVHGFLAERSVYDGAGDDPGERAKRALRRAGHDSVVAYVDHAEAEGWHGGSTCQARRVWFDLGPLPTPDAFVPKLLRERVFTIRNRARAVPTNAIDCLSVRDGVDPDVLLGVLDSSLGKATMEVWGRDEAGLLQLMTDETRTLPVPDVRTLSSQDATRIREAGRVLDDDGGAGSDRQVALDEAVVGALDVDPGPGQIRRLRERLLRRRVDGGDRIEAPIS